MAHQPNSKKVKSVDTNFLRTTILQFKLIMRLLGDSRVNGFYKLLPWGSLLYLISPIDLISGALMPVIGAADDVAIMWFGFTLFLELCPTEVVDEHLEALTGQSSVSTDNDVVDAEVIDLDD